MLVLGLETSSYINSAAITQNEELQGQVIFNQKKPQSNSLVQSIEFLLKSLDIKGEKLDGIAVSIGPGSYTGLRVSLSVAKSLAFCWDKPLTVVNSLDALAQQGSHQDNMICSLIRFRRHEYHNAFFYWSDSTIHRRSDYLTSKIEDVVSDLTQPVLFIGLVTDEDKELFLTHGHKANCVIFSEKLPEARLIALQGERNLRKGIKENINEISPFYMHEFPIKN